tara:strand:- start:107 stop:367 length:261 start_codon:yes stop_codon:yes gene_type:complete
MNKDNVNTTHKIQDFGKAGYSYRGASIDYGIGSRNRKVYEVNVTKLATEQYRANFYNTIVTHKFITSTLNEAVETINNMFDNGDLA